MSSTLTKKPNRSLRSQISEQLLGLRCRLDPKPAPRLLVLYLFADTRKYPDSFASLRSILRHCGNSFVVKIDNFSRHEKVITLDDQTLEISGDNSSWEFSGWKTGMAYARTHLAGKFDYVLFINDAFLNLSDRGRDLDYYRKTLNQFTIRSIKSDALGDAYATKQTHVIKGLPVNAWIKSSLFCLPYHVAAQLKFTYISPDEMDIIVPGDFHPDRFTQPNPLMNEEFRSFVEDWLLNRWQWKVRPQAENWGFLKAKLKAIVNERLLTADIKSFGCRILTRDNKRALGGVAKLKVFSK